MKQILQNYRSGEVRVEEVPVPVCADTHLLVQNAYSLVSAGTERSMRDFAQMSLVSKARARPDLVKKVMSKVKQEGLRNTVYKALSRLDTLAPLGYSCCGQIVETGQKSELFQVGDHVACAGAGWANHAEMVSVPHRLCAKVPDGVTPDEAAFSTLGAVALHGIRLAELTLGENVVVIGLGLLGQIACQIVRASGCCVIGVDLASDKVDLALELGADFAVARDDDPIAKIRQFTKNKGVDAVLITAAAPTSDPVEMAPELCRDRGRVVVIGDVKLNLPRRTYYHKEISFRISRSYGPGRYDVTYERDGYDYPLGYVRWTQQRNLSAFLDLMARKQVNVRPLISHTFDIENAEEAYELIGSQVPHLGILLRYPEIADLKNKVSLQDKPKMTQVTTQGIGVIGAGTFASGVILPRLKKMKDVTLLGICSQSGISARHFGERFDFSYCTSDRTEVITDTQVGCVMIMTRHGDHADFVIEALNAEKHVFVEKPLALSFEELERVVEAYHQTDRCLMVGFNRRFSPATNMLKSHFINQGSVSVICRVNAGVLPEDHWIYDPETGGGRLLGEVCHFIDLCGYLVQSRAVRVSCVGMGAPYPDDHLAITLEYANGSTAQILYTAFGGVGMPKEYIEMLGGGRSAVLDDFREVNLFVDGQKKRKRFSGQDKGHQKELEALVASLQNAKTDWPMSFDSIVHTTVTTLCAQQAMLERCTVNIPEFLVSSDS